METSRPDDVAEMNVRFPSDILHLEIKWPVGKHSKGHAPKSGPSIDAWGCTWQLGENGALDGLIESPLADAAAIPAFQPPLELLDPARFAKVNSVCEDSGRFALASSEVRPLDRLRQLRGSEAALAELCEGSQDLRGLLARMHEFYLKEIALWPEPRSMASFLATI